MMDKFRILAKTDRKYSMYSDDDRMKATRSKCNWTWHTKDDTGSVTLLLCDTHGSVIAQSNIDLSLTCENRVVALMETIDRLEMEMRGSATLLPSGQIAGSSDNYLDPLS